MEEHSAPVYLVNTGWTGGAYGSGRRIDLPTTRKIIDAILDSSIENCEMVTDPLFGLRSPLCLADIGPEVLQPRQSWSDADAYDQSARQLAAMFQENYQQYCHGDYDYSKYGPQL
jgi:phosphoenolpyruvate carboxykinase (ATP)